MTRLAHVGCAATVIVATTAVGARADPINISAGSLFMDSPAGQLGYVNLVGTGGFSLVGRAASYTRIGLFNQCGVPECPPGTRVNFNLDLSGASGFLGGAMTIGGDQYEVTDSVNAMADVFLRFDGSFIAPEMGSAQAIAGAKAATTRKRRAAGRKAATTRKRRAAAAKARATRQSRSTAAAAVSAEAVPPPVAGLTQTEPKAGGTQ